jgi:hypothetical protein
MQKKPRRYAQLSTPMDIQDHVRTHGAVMTRLDIYSDFRPFFQASPKGTYMGPDPNARLVENHAILVVGALRVAAAPASFCFV